MPAWARRWYSPGALVVERPDPDEPRRPLGLVGQDRQAAVGLHRVRGDDLGWDPPRQGLGDGALPEAVGPKIARTCPRSPRPETAASVTAEGPAAGLPPLRA